MKTTTLWIIRLALMVQFIGVLAVPTLIAAAEAPRAMWLAEWLNPSLKEPVLSERRTSIGEGRLESNGRTIGVLELRNGRLAFTEQVGQVDWNLDLAEIKSVTVVNDGRALLVESLKNEAFVTTIMESNLTPQSPKKALSIIERAMQHLSTNNR